jgi:hypothetical protein
VVVTSQGRVSIELELGLFTNFLRFLFLIFFNEFTKKTSPTSPFTGGIIGGGDGMLYERLQSRAMLANW